MGDNGPGQWRRGQNNAAKPRMRVNKPFARCDCEMQLPVGNTAQYYVTRTDGLSIYCAEATTIQSGSNSLQIIASQRIVARDLNRTVSDSLRHHTHAIETRFCISSMQSEANPDQTERTPRELHAMLSWHRDSASKDRCPANKARRES